MLAYYKANWNMYVVFDPKQHLIIQAFPTAGALARKYPIIPWHSSYV